MEKNIETTDLKGISRMFSIPLWTLRKWASERKFPGIIKRDRRVYIDVKKFRTWFYEGEVKNNDMEKGGGYNEEV